MIGNGYGDSMFLATNGILARTASGGGVDPDAQAFITAASITDPTQQSAINQLVVDLKGYSIWSKMKALYPFVGGTAAQHKWNLKDPRDLDAAFRLVFNGGWTHSSTGATPNGTNGYADTFFVPSNNGLTSSSGHLSIYSRSNIAEDRHDIGGVTGGIENMLASRYTSNLFYVNYGTQTYPNVSNNDSRGHFITNRNSTTNTTGFKNGIRVINTAQTGGATTIKLFIGARNNQGNPNVYSSKENAFTSIGDGLTDTEAANFYTAVQSFQTTLGRQVGTPIPYASFPLDTYSGASAAYSLRRLRTAYTGSLIRVRRSSDNTEMDFGYNSNNVLDTSALLTFCGAGNGFVTTWYDQSGNANNATQTTAINQPQIVFNGVISTNNSTPSIVFDGSNDFLNPVDFALPTSSIFSVVKTLSANQYNSIYNRGTTAGNASRDALLYVDRTNSKLEFQRSNNVSFPTASTSININNTILATGIYTGSELNVYANGTIGTSQSTTISGTISNPSSAIGAAKESGIVVFFCYGYFNEVIVYASNQSTNRTGIESNINSFYTIY